MSKVSKFYVGQSAEETITVTEKLIYETADFSGDYNPIHTSKEYAEKTRFKGRIAHSLVCEALTSKLIGMKLPGAGAVFITMSFVCTKPDLSEMRVRQRQYQSYRRGTGHIGYAGAMPQPTGRSGGRMRDQGAISGTGRRLY